MSHPPCRRRSRSILLGVGGRRLSAFDGHCCGLSAQAQCTLTGKTRGVSLKLCLGRQPVGDSAPLRRVSEVVPVCVCGECPPHPQHE